MPSFTASAHSVNGTPRHEVDVDSPHAGADPTSPTATEAATLVLLPTSSWPRRTTSCASTMIVLYAQRKDWPLEHVQVDVSYDSDTTPRRAKIIVNHHGDLTDAQIQRLLRVGDACPVKRALEDGFLIRQRLADGDVPSGNGAAALVG